jgi:hypothetical protein
LIKAGASTYIGVDYTHTYNGSAPYYNINGVGRPSVRIESQKSWTHGLFIADITHMPGGICGTWPALWTLGPNWPNNGEIDIIEGANNQNKDLSSAHTGGVCTIAGGSSTMTGTLQTNDCDLNDNDNTVGCGISDDSTQSYGTGFNAINGGVYAMEWTSAAIQIWFFPRRSIPSDISSGNTPNPANWGEPDAIFNGPDCNIDNNFANNSLVIDTTFCGDFAGATWAASGGCASLTGQSSCSVYVGSNPSVFKNAYWEFNYIKVFQAQAVSTTSSSTSTTTRSRRFMPRSSTFMPTSSSMSYGPYGSLTTTSPSSWSIYSTSSSSSSSTTGTVTSGWPVSTLMAPAMGGGVDVNRAGPFGLDGYAWGPATTATVTGDDGQVYTTVLTGKFIPTRSPAFPDTSVSTETWVDVCETGYTTQTTTVTTTYSSCTETPTPTIPMKTITTTCPDGWAITDPVTLTVPWTDEDDWTTASTATPTWTWTSTSSVPTTLTAWPVPASTPTYGAWATATTTPVKVSSTTGNSTWVAGPTTPWLATYTGMAARVDGGMTWFVTAVVAGGVALLL